ncbi:MAG: mechanosensitive ion channel [Chloroflexi bacterium]|nr:mechanosensitive ion channel [Chloroflexota bacterium]
MDTYLNDWVAAILAFLPNLLVAVLIFLGSLYLAKLLSGLLRKVLQQRRADAEVTLLLTQLTRWSIIVVGIITALQRFFDVTAFLAGLGILGFTVGFAMQDIMQNFVAGIILLIQQPFNVGDAIDVADYGGTVLAINLRTTEMRTWDGRIVIIPNADVLANAIINYTRAERRRVELSVGIGYGSDPEATRQAVLQAVTSIPGYLADPAPKVVFHTFGESSIDLTVYFWVDTTKTDVFSAKDAALTHIKAALDKQGVDIPYPIRTIYMQKG